MRFWFCALALLAGGCWAPKPQAPLASAPAEFSHEVHLAPGQGLSCASCHAVKPEAGYSLLRPGSDQHKACVGCHEAEFKTPPGNLCLVCHESVDPKTKGGSPLTRYPGGHLGTQLVREFDHRLHLDDADGAPGLKCAACHTEAGDSPYMGFPSHPVCAGCHAKATETAEPKMNDCAGCHDQRAPTKDRNFLANDIRFTHAKHRVDVKGDALACEGCHALSRQRGTVQDLELPSMARCATCHEDASRTPDTVRINACAVCHRDHVDARERPADHTATLLAPSIGSSGVLTQLLPSLTLPLSESLDVSSKQAPLRKLADRAQSPNLGVLDRVREPVSTRRPEDHTAMFRVRHGPAASSPDAKCRYCHTGLSGSPLSSCQDCHAVMRPRSHTGRFRGVKHGREAAIDERACATCHEVDYCTSCHQIPPPNHFPLNRFRLDHSRRARASARSCLTCHSFEATCSQCHARDVQGPAPLRPQ